MTEVTEKKVYSVKEIQEILAISKNAVYKLISNDPPFKILKIGTTYRVQKKSFDNWFEGNYN